MSTYICTTYLHSLSISSQPIETNVQVVVHLINLFKVGRNRLTLYTKPSVPCYGDTILSYHCNHGRTIILKRVLKYNSNDNILRDTERRNSPFFSIFSTRSTCILINRFIVVEYTVSTMLCMGVVGTSYLLSLLSLTL